MPKRSRLSGGDEFSRLSTEVLGLRLQALNLPSGGTRQQQIDRLRQATRGGEEASPSAPRGKRGRQAPTSHPTDPTTSHPTDPTGFSEAQLSVIRKTVSDALASWRPPQQDTPSPPVVASEGTPGSASPLVLDRPLDEALEGKITRGEYIDLALLLPDNLAHAGPEFQLGFAENSESVRLLRNKRQSIDSFYKWVIAYTRYALTIVTAFPRRAREMIQYQAIISSAAAKYRGFAWLTYDENFRRYAAQDRSIPWDRVNLELWTVTFAGLAKPHCASCSSPFHRSEDCPSGQHRLATHRSPRIHRNNVCFDFNRVTGCSRQACIYPHVCQKCADSHPAHQCRAGISASACQRQGNRSQAPGRPAAQ
ncbi:uncharacterized protein LOC116612504 isoform X1 [Nematostella vectensis]|uniref:uncharacterized protein LOC116612504 isoform X1 n=1 Tax=Nematostella vectensis TaxID=45351 RepID=UPI002077478A|nr:uncharacterized protein LOC116612504 isoform X1 [Nematostella vectensis]